MRYLIFFTLFLLHFTSFAQSFWYLPATHPSYKSANLLLTTLHTAAGDSSHIPHLEVEKKGMNPPQTASVAYYNAFLEEIVIEEEIVELCRSFQQDSTAALAFVLGHELAHHNLGHTSSQFCPFHVQDEIVSNPLMLQNEINADKVGNFYARLAGFSPCDLGEKLIHQIYQQFAIQNNVNYPSQNNRIAILQNNCQSADTLSSLFYVAKNLAKQQEYTLSLTLFQHILQLFPSKEMYLNAATVQLQWIVNEGFETTDSLYEMPLLFENEVHFRKGLSPNALRTLIKKRENYLKQSAQYLHKALAIDGNYALANMYLGYVHYLEGKMKGTCPDALVLMSADSHFSPYEKECYSTLLGIQAAIDGNKTLAKACFQQSKHTDIAQYNICLLEGRVLPEKKAIFEPNPHSQIASLNGKLLFSQGDLQVEVIENIAKNYYLVKEKEKKWYFE
jgi:Peptidase family M48